MKDSKDKSKPSQKLRSLSSIRNSRTFHSDTAYGIMRRGQVVGGISNPDLFSLEGAKEWMRDVPRNTKIVKIRVTHEVIAEVIV